MAQTALSRKTNTPEHFWSRVTIGAPNDCWPFTGYLHAQGYGVVTRNKVATRAHRLAYELHHGVTLPRQSPPRSCRSLVLHSCDNRACCNPAHLRLGTHRDNRDDCVARGRNNTPVGDANNWRRHPETRPRGSRHPRTKLAEADVLDIRRRSAAGESNLAIGRMYAITGELVWKIKTRRTWRHI